MNRRLAVADIRLETRPPVKPKAMRPAPTGPLDCVVPSGSIGFPIGWPGCQGGLGSVAGERNLPHRIGSSPRREPAWVKGPNRYFDHRREIELRDDAIVVRDTFTNLTHDNLPLMQRHRVHVPGLKKVWLAGLSPAGRVGSSSDPGNPTSYAVTAQAGVGLIAIDDVSQVHVTNFSGDDFSAWPITSAC